MADTSKTEFLRNILLIVVLAAIVIMRIFPPHGAGTSGAHAPARAPVAAASQQAEAPTSSPGAAASAYGAGVGFRSQERLDEHWAKHGGEFASLGIRDEAAYLRAAQALRDAPVGGDVKELRRAADGVISRFDVHTGAFEAFGTDGVIRTFFRPRDGLRYFERQALRAPESR
jgi:pyocin large subunit-like protein